MIASDGICQPPCSFVLANVARVETSRDYAGNSGRPQSGDIWTLQPMTLRKRPIRQFHGMGKDDILCVLDGELSELHLISPSGDAR
jgi:hypothetical protein